MDLNHYILDNDHRVVKTDDLLVWGRFMSNRKRRVDLTYMRDAEISTVFLGLNHRYTDDGPPLLFETMIFGGEHNNYCRRYSSWDDAVVGHEMAVNMVRRCAMTPENEKARQLLFSFLTPEQREGFLTSLGFIVIGERTKHKYKLAFHGGLSVFDDQFSYCINLKCNDYGCFPPYEDHILAQKIVLETDELYFLRTAHRSASFATPLRFTLGDAAFAPRG